MPRSTVQLCIAGLLFAAFSAGAKEISEIAYELAHKEMSAAEWKQYVTSVRKKYETWASDNAEGSMKRYLDDKTIEMAPSVMHGNPKALKSMVCWVALYNEFNEPPLARLNQFMMAHEQDLEELLTDFSWERAAAKIKERKMKYDEEQKIRMARK